MNPYGEIKKDKCKHERMVKTVNLRWNKKEEKFERNGFTLAREVKVLEQLSFCVDCKYVSWEEIEAIE